MIEQVKVKKGEKTIPDDFSLELDKITVITGENNTGKTNFIKILEANKEVDFLDENGETCKPKIVYIAAENIVPLNDELKASAANAALVKRVTELLENLDIEFKLDNEDDLIGAIEKFRDKANVNLESFTGSSHHQLTFNQGEIAASVIVQSLIDKFDGKEGDDKRKLSELGQGTQRIIIAAVLKAYLDILIEQDKVVDEPILILFEEPEIYLHPKLKRTLNATLEDIAGQEKHQVIITTHDPYFTFMNFDEDDKKLHCFTKTEGVTKSEESVITGIEDELLFILLYSKLKKAGGNLSVAIPEFTTRPYTKDDGTDNGKTETPPPLTNIRDQIHHLGDNKHTQGPVSDVSEVETGKNYYLYSELKSAIKVMSQELAS